ncbi:MAG TPA: hypothetical protein VHX65_13080 [Pirellulales bacterium]|jgi:hypothetical protein|nr:hypothetical protein [Pirellulales bacterium]
MTERKTLPANIAWLSTCLLVAAAGELIGDSMDITWFLQGTFGLISAVGLQMAAHRAAA